MARLLSDTQSRQDVHLFPKEFKSVQDERQANHKRANMSMLAAATPRCCEFSIFIPPGPTSSPLGAITQDWESWGPQQRFKRSTPPSAASGLLQTLGAYEARQNLPPSAAPHQVAAWRHSWRDSSHMRTPIITFTFIFTRGGRRRQSASSSTFKTASAGPQHTPSDPLHTPPTHVVRSLHRITYFC